MPYRKSVIVSGEVYHVFNRGIAGMPVFSAIIHFRRFLDLINYYRFKDTPVSFSKLKKINNEARQNILDDLVKKKNQQVEILAFCLMDNHFHFLLKQVSDRGIVKFISNLQNSYAKYFNAKTKRSGPLFQPMFKTVRVITDEQLLHVSRYIHLNPATGYLVKIEELEAYPWSSLPCYLELLEYPFVDQGVISSLIKDRRKHKEFVLNQAKYQRELGKIKHLMLE